MFEAGQYIVYGNTGVCKVQEVKEMAVPGAKTQRLYYSLEPVYHKGRTVYTPVDNEKVVMRSVLTAQEAEALISRIAGIEILQVENERNREQMYRDTIRSGSCDDLIKIIKTIYQRKKTRLAAGKKVTTGDTKYLHMAEENLYGELAVVLGKSETEVEELITEKIEG